MTALQRIQLRQSELRSEIAAELDKDAEQRDHDALERMTNEMKGVEVEVRAALAAEAEDLPDDEVSDDPDGDAADREFAELRSKVNLGQYIQAALAGRGVVAGPELEYNQAIGLREDYFDLAILAGEPELRAKRDGDANANQAAWLDRVFQNTAASHLGITMRSVSPGIHAIPVTTAGGAPLQRGREQDATESTYTVAVTEIKPSRAAVHGVYSIEDDLRLPGLADAIQRDMRMSMVETIDRKIFIGDTGADEAAGDIVGLQTAGIQEKTITQANKVKADKVLEYYTGLVDGTYAGSVADLNLVVSVGTYRLWENTIHNSAAENQTIAQFLRSAGLSWRTRGSIDTATAAADFGGYTGLKNGIMGAGVAAVWRGAQLIRDMYSGAKSGEVELTMNYFWQLAFPRLANFKRLKYVA